MLDNHSMEANEIWAYRETGKHPLQPVRFLRHRRNTNKRNAHVQIRFEDPDADGLETWVPTGRLKCLWADAEAFEENERRWLAVIKASRDSAGVVDAVESVVCALMPDETWARVSPPKSLVHSSGKGVFGFRNLEALSEVTGLPVEQLSGEPTAFYDEGVWVVPLPTALSVAKRLAPLDPLTILREVEGEERQLAAREESWRLRGPRSGPDEQTRDDWDVQRQSFALRREWVGEESITLRDEAIAAQQEAERLRNLVTWAIKKLAGYGHKSSAETLRRNLDAG